MKMVTRIALANAKPPNTQVLEDTRPIAALALAPNFPTIALSIYCIIIDDICVNIAGILNFHTFFINSLLFIH